MAVYERGGALIAQADVRRGVDVDEPVLGELGGLNPQALAEVLHEIVLALHLIDDVVREEDLERAVAFRVEEVVEAGGGLHLCARHAERSGDSVEALAGELPQLFLYIAKQAQEPRSYASPACNAARDCVLDFGAD